MIEWLLNLYSLWSSYTQPGGPLGMGGFFLFFGSIFIMVMLIIPPAVVICAKLFGWWFNLWFKTIGKWNV
jgi:hypothetical protein